MAPSRALSTIAVLILIFFLSYAYAVRAPKRDGIWRIWSDERVRDDLGSDKPELLSATGFSAMKMALYFSLLSAFHIGWRDLNVGNWITRGVISGSHKFQAENNHKAIDKYSRATMHKTDSAVVAVVLSDIHPAILPKASNTSNITRLNVSL